MHLPTRRVSRRSALVLLAACTLCFSTALAAQPMAKEIDAARAACAMEKARVRQLEGSVDEQRARQERSQPGTDAQARIGTALTETEISLRVARKEWERACVRADALMSGGAAQ